MGFCILRLCIHCQPRLGICADILGLLAKHEIDLRGIEIDHAGSVFLNFPTLEFDALAHLMPSIRRLDGIHDVTSVPYMPIERLHQETKLLLKALPEPIISINRKGLITVVNQAACELLTKDATALKNQKLSDFTKGFRLSQWLNHAAPEPSCVRMNLGSRAYLADLYPIYLPDDDSNDVFSGAVISFKSPQRLGKQMGALQKSDNAFDAIVATSPIMKQVIDNAKRMSGLDAPLLITGETGSGKEVLARACHAHSMRRELPFLVINCASIPDDVIETELFGFSETRDGTLISKKGIVELAEGGTVFLDELGDMSLILQNKLLRLLQDGTYRRVGDEQERRSDIRIISATQKQLPQLISQGSFREDLYYRLNVLTLNVPPLKLRSADVLVLANQFIKQFSTGRDQPIRLTNAAAEKLTQYAWPGNVRQLENTILRAVSLVDGDRLTPDQLLLPEACEPQDISDEHFEGSLEQSMKRFESRLLARLYPDYPSSRQLGKKLGVSHTAIANKLREYKIGR